MNAVRSHPLRIAAAVFLVAGALAMLAGFVASKIELSKESETAAQQAPMPGEDIAALMAKLQQEPNDGKTLFQLGKLFFDAQEFARASNFLNRAAISSPSDATVWYWLGVSLYYEEKFAESAEALESSIHLQKDPEAMYNLAIIYKYRLDQKDKAGVLLEELSAMRDLPADFTVKVRRELESKP